MAGMKYGMNRDGLYPQEEGPRGEDKTGVMPFGARRPAGRMATGGSVVNTYEYSTGDVVKKQGYNARKDEQLGMTRGKESGKKMSMTGRRKVAKATSKPKGSYGFNKKGKA